MARYRCKGMTLAIDKTGGGTTYTKVAQVESADIPSPSNDPVNDTDLDSVAQEFSPGLPDYGDASYELRFDPDDDEHDYLESWNADPTIKSVKVTVPTLPLATYYTFDAFPTGLTGRGGANEDKLMASLAIKVTGPVVKTKESGGS